MKMIKADCPVSRVFQGSLITQIGEPNGVKNATSGCEIEVDLEKDWEHPSISQMLTRVLKYVPAFAIKKMLQFCRKIDQQHGAYGNYRGSMLSLAHCSLHSQSFTTFDVRNSNTGAVLKSPSRKFQVFST